MATSPAYISPQGDSPVYSSPILISDQAVLTILNVSSYFTGIISFFGVISNIINSIIFIIQGFQDTINISLFSISMTDIGSSLAVLWYSLCHNPVLMRMYENWEFAEVEYVTSGWPRVGFVRVKGMLTALITIERYLCIAYPLTVRRFVTPCRTFTVNLVIFVITAVLVFPVLCSFSLAHKFSTSKNQTVFGIVYSSEAMTIINSTTPINNFLQVLSFVMVALLTIMVVHKLNNNLKWRHASTAVTKNSSTLKRGQRVAKLVILISVNFIFCYMPVVVFFLATRFEEQFRINGHYKNIFSTVGIITLLSESMNASTNILIYLKISSKFKQVFFSLMSCKLRLQSC